MGGYRPTGNITNQISLTQIMKCSNICIGNMLRMQHYEHFKEIPSFYSFWVEHSFSFQQCDLIILGARTSMTRQIANPHFCERKKGQRNFKGSL